MLRFMTVAELTEIRTELFNAWKAAIAGKTYTINLGGNHRILLSVRRYIL